MQEVDLSERSSYSRGERVTDAVVHEVGILAALVACALLAATVPWTGRVGPLFAPGISAAGLLMMLGCSAFYNPAGKERRRALQRRLDHSAIFAMIAST